MTPPPSRVNTVDHTFYLAPPTRALALAACGSGGDGIGSAGRGCRLRCHAAHIRHHAATRRAHHCIRSSFRLCSSGCSSGCISARGCVRGCVRGCARTIFGSGACTSSSTISYPTAWWGHLR